MILFKTSMCSVVVCPLFLWKAKPLLLQLQRWITVFQQTKQSRVLVPPHSIPAVHPSLTQTWPAAINSHSGQKKL